MRKELEKILNNPFLTDNGVESEVLKLIYSKNKENTLNLFLKIQELDKKRIEEENMILYRGLEDGMHSLTSVCKHLLEEKTSRKAKDYAKILFKEVNIAYLINICKAYFPEGNSKGASNNGKWFFEKFKEMVINNKEKYLEGGDSYKWVQMQGHESYINKILKD